jgi:hypothetical protein
VSRRQAENTQDRLSFCAYQQKATIFAARFCLNKKSRMLRAIFAPPGHGGCRFSHHWQHSFAAPAPNGKQRQTASLSRTPTPTETRAGAKLGGRRNRKAGVTFAGSFFGTQAKAESS